MAELRAPRGATRRKKRVGRGPSSGHGKTSGKGHKGQNARSGGKVRPGFEGGQMPLYRRIARRGFSNYPFKVEYTGVNLSTLDKRFGDGDTVTLQSLKEKKVVKNRVENVKILGQGELGKKLTVQGLKVSKGAEEKITAAGGTVQGE
ncbi:MAG: 50S ribosomal protein L15 [Spirochaetaceae bacterium]